MTKRRFLGAVAVVILTGPHLASAASECDTLLAADFSRTPEAATHLTLAQLVTRENLPEYCQVEGYVAPQVGLSLRMPSSGWNGRLLFQGCGGFCGSLRQIEDCNDAIARGYACVTTDLGHRSTPIDGKWAYNNRAAEIDFYYRATHVTTVAAKAVVEQYYGTLPDRSYLRGCSTGGRQGLVSAQRFPDDFDGIIAAAPAGVAASGGLHLIWSALANRNERGRPILAESDIGPLHDAVMGACDALDGHRDGILADPGDCEFDPGSIVCTADSDGFCLSDEKVDAARRIYSGAVDQEGNSLYRAVPMYGSEPNWVPAYVRDEGPSIYYLFGGDFFRYLAFDQDPGPDWLPEDFDLAADLPRLKLMRTLNYAANPDLSEFEARGGKLILYQGWRDQSVPPLGTVDYFELAERTMGGPDAFSRMARLYMLPGVGHCRGGAGADSADFLTLIENWTENGVAPDAIEVSKLEDPDGPWPSYPLDDSNVIDTWVIEPWPGSPTPKR